GVAYAEVERTVPLDRVLSERDLRELGDAERATRLQGLLRDESSRPVHLQNAPLRRVMLVRETGDRFVLSLVVHHLISDGWSLGVIVGDLTRLCVSLAED